MNKLDKAISIAKKLIDMPYNLFNLENFWEILDKHFSDIGSILTAFEKSSVISLMSGNHKQVGIATHNYPNKNKKNIYIIGKGILFDSGGLDLKRPGSMAGMYDDKAGAIIALAVADYFKDNVVAYCPVTTNFIQNSLITSGDEIKIGKKIVKVNNTDAEGRLILAEALSTLAITKDDIVITIATLTGCCASAIGNKATAYLTPNEDLATVWSYASFKAKELSWRLPLWDYIEKDFFKKKIIKNANSEIIADTIGAAVFLKQFVKYSDRWIHLDIAYSAFDKKGKANGVPLKSLVNFIKEIK